MSLAPLSAAASFAAQAISAGVKQITQGLSFQSHLADAANQSPSKSHATPSAEPSSEFRRTLETALRRFRDAVYREFASKGIDSSIPVELSADGLGGVTANDSHPDRLAIERIFAGNDGLVAAFHDLESQSARLQSMDKQPSQNTDSHQSFGVRLSGDDAELLSVPR